MNDSYCNFAKIIDVTIEDIQNDIIQEFEMFDDWMQRYEYIIELGRSLPLIDPQYKIEDYHRSTGKGKKVAAVKTLVRIYNHNKTKRLQLAD